ncbi:hypothetical protein NMY22_g12267 [Coprinellus aureogranulatus]|nr:hypothetical protein NMY22_g12267 [Coprinellus aureogranulatus]
MCACFPVVRDSPRRGGFGGPSPLNSLNIPRPLSRSSQPVFTSLPSDRSFILDDFGHSVGGWAEMLMPLIGTLLSMKQIRYIFIEPSVTVPELPLSGATCFKDASTRTQSKNTLEFYAYNSRIFPNEDELADKFDTSDKETFKSVLDEAIRWLDNSHQAFRGGYEFKFKQKESKPIASPIMQRLYGATGGAPGGAPDSFPGTSAPRNMDVNITNGTPYATHNAMPFQKASVPQDPHRSLVRIIYLVLPRRHLEHALIPFILQHEVLRPEKLFDSPLDLDARDGAEFRFHGGSRLLYPLILGQLPPWRSNSRHPAIYPRCSCAAKLTHPGEKRKYMARIWQHVVT